MADYDVEADLPTLLEALRDRGDLVSVRAAEAIEHLRPKRVCDDCIGRSDGGAVVCVHMLDPFAYDDEAGRYQCLRCEQWSDEDDDTIEHLEDCPVGQPMLAGPELIDVAASHSRWLRHNGYVQPADCMDRLCELLILVTGRLTAEPTAAPTRPTREQVRDPRPWSPLVERFRSALMREHADDWSMETVAEAAYICAGVVTSTVTRRHVTDAVAEQLEWGDKPWAVTEYDAIADAVMELIGGDDA